MKILVTGGAGFIGSHVADALIAQGHDVAVMDNLYMGKTENINPKAKFFQTDIRSEEAAKIISQNKYEAIIHHAAQMDVRVSVERPIFDAEINIIGTLNLLDAGIKNGLKKFIFASSGGTVYGEQQKFPADENHSCQPISPYGISKRAIEMYLDYFHKIFGLSYVALRYANVYGPRQNPHGEAGVVAIFADKMLNRQQPFVNGNGKQTRDYVYVTDVVDANLRALRYKESGCFNVGTAIEKDVNFLFDTINELTGKTTERKHAPAKAGEQFRSVLSYEKIKKKMGWQPKVKIKDGLRMTVEWFKTCLTTAREK